MAIVSEHFISAELADWQTPVKDKDLTTSPESPSNGDRYVIAGTGGDWSAGTINDIVWYITSEWYFITPTEGMQVYLEDENLYYFYNGSSWGTISGGSSLWEVDGTETQLKVADEIDMQTKKIINAVDPTSNQDVATKKYVDDNISNIIKNTNNIILNAFRIAVNGSLAIFNMIDGIVDEYEDETGINAGASSGESYNSSGDYYTQDSTGGEGIDTYTKLCLHCNGVDESTSFPDASASDHTVTANGDAEVDTAQKEFGTGSLKVDGTGDYLTVPNHADWDVGSGNFTIDFRMRPSNYSSNWGTFAISGISANTANQMAISWYTVNGLQFTIYDDDWASLVSLSQDATSGWSADTWYHVAIVRNGNTFSLYRDGVLLDSTTYSGAVPDYSSDLYIGCQYNSGNVGSYFPGHIDEFRWSKGIARWTSAFTPPTAEYAEPTEDNMTLVSDSFTAEANPSNARIVILEEDVDAITINTDIKAYVSEDNGSNWHQITLSDEGDYDSNKRILTGSVALTDESDTDMIYKIATLNDKDCKIHATALSWD